MTPQIFQDIFAYTFWADRQVWKCLDGLSDEQLNQASEGRDSLHDEALHTMAVEHWWLVFIASGRLWFLEENEYPTRASIRTMWDRIEENVTRFLSTLTEQDLQREVRPNFWPEGRKPIPVWQALFQVANHSTDHRAQMLAHIKQLGGKTVEQDYLGFLVEKQQAVG